MGHLIYDNETHEFEDRALFHLQIAMSTKLRRGENFFFTWSVPTEYGSGRHAIWIDNGVPLHFFYRGSRQIPINREWVEALVQSAGRATGMYLGEEAQMTSGGVLTER